MLDLAAVASGFVLVGVVLSLLLPEMPKNAEREVVALTHEEAMDPVVLTYLNRLSDWLFALARAENAVAGVPDVEWKG